MSGVCRAQYDKVKWKYTSEWVRAVTSSSSFPLRACLYNWLHMKFQSETLNGKCLLLCSLSNIYRAVGILCHGILCVYIYIYILYGQQFVGIWPSHLYKLVGCWTSHSKSMGTNIEQPPFAAITTSTMLGRLCTTLWSVSVKMCAHSVKRAFMRSGTGVGWDNQ